MTQKHYGPADKPTRVLIVDDHPVVREGLIAMIATQPDLSVCGEASEADEAYAMIRATEPSVVIVDLALRKGHGLELIKRLSVAESPAKVLVVSAYEEQLFAERALSAGAHGYINKQKLQVEIIDGIRAVLRGELYVSIETAQRLLEQTISGKGRRRGPEDLSDRELQIFELIGQGKSTRLIARQLHLSIHTIESHRENIRAKLNLASGVELVQHAVQWVLEKRF